MADLISNSNDVDSSQHPTKTKSSPAPFGTREQYQKLSQQVNDFRKASEHNQKKMNRCEQKLDSLETKLSYQTQINEHLLEKITASEEQQAHL